MSERTYRRLTAAKVNKLAKIPGAHCDGDGTYLMVSPAGVASWSYRYMINGRSREMGLGPLRHVSLAQARQLADTARALKRQGIDPVEARRTKSQSDAVKKAKVMTFRQCATAYIGAHRTGWRNATHAEQWPASLEKFAHPTIGDLPVNSVDTDLVMQVVGPIWQTKTETASRVRGRMEAILDWATVSGYRTGENPARWRGHLEHNLPKKRKVAAVEHHPALAYAEMPAFMAELRKLDDPGARALEFAILTAARTGEVLGARWDDIKLEERYWDAVPEQLHTNKKRFRVPLSDGAMAILVKQAAMRQNEFVFVGRDGAQAGRDTLRTALKRVGRMGLSVHGFRSTFSDWTAEQTSFSPEAREAALGHVIVNKVEAAYRRGDLFAKRRQLANAWARFCASPAGADSSVVPLRRKTTTA